MYNLLLITSTGIALLFYFNWANRVFFLHKPKKPYQKNWYSWKFLFM